VVEEGAQGNASGDLQRAVRHHRHRADVQRLVSEALPHAGVYEWITAPDGKKLPIYFTRADSEPIAFAAIQDAWKNPESSADEASA
jgi:putative SOS response-associated peptidase YedK